MLHVAYYEEDLMFLNATFPEIYPAPHQDYIGELTANENHNKTIVVKNQKQSVSWDGKQIIGLDELKFSNVAAKTKFIKQYRAAKNHRTRCNIADHYGFKNEIILGLRVSQGTLAKYYLIFTVCMILSIVSSYHPNILSNTFYLIAMLAFYFIVDHHTTSQPHAPDNIDHQMLPALPSSIRVGLRLDEKKPRKFCQSLLKFLIVFFGLLLIINFLTYDYANPTWLHDINDDGISCRRTVNQFYQHRFTRHNDTVDSYKNIIISLLHMN
jgi:hypothetical protein